MVILLQQKNFGPNVIYFALGITEDRPAGAFLGRQNCILSQKRVLQGLLGGSNCILSQKSVPLGLFGPTNRIVIVCRGKSRRVDNYSDLEVGGFP